MDSARRLLNVLTCLRLNTKYWTSPDLNSMRWLGLFANKTFRKLFPHWDLIISTVSLAIFHPHLSSSFSILILSYAFFHPHFIIRIFPSAFCHPYFSIRIFHPHFIIRIFPSAFYHLHFSIRHLPSAIRHPPSAIRHPPPTGPHFTETHLTGEGRGVLLNDEILNVQELCC